MYAKGKIPITEIKKKITLPKVEILENGYLLFYLWTAKADEN